MSLELVTVIEQPTQLTTIIEVGQGPAGRPGLDGVGDLNRIFTQGTPAAVWTIGHALGKYPAVTAVDSAGDTVEGKVTYVDVNNLVIVFSAAFSGQAYLN